MSRVFLILGHSNLVIPVAQFPVSLFWAVIAGQSSSLKRKETIPQNLRLYKSLDFTGWSLFRQKA
ncbi:hypothetical protein B5G33_04670 [Blautia sp. An81]|nr:hypothetical protein B5G33_04670 [Blautia sp. An81]